MDSANNNLHVNPVAHPLASTAETDSLTKPNLIQPRLRQVMQVLLSCTLMFVTGATFALGVFTMPIEQYAPDTAISVAAPTAPAVSPVQGAWPFGMGLMHLMSAPVLIVTGFILDKSRASCDSRTLRYTALTASLSFALLGLGSAGVVAGSRVLVVAALAFQSVPLGVFYPLVTEHLFAWMPDIPAAAAALAQLAFGAGSIIVAWLFNVLIVRVGVAQAVMIAAASMVVATSMPAVLMTWPDTELDAARDADARSEALSVSSVNSEHTALLHRGDSNTGYTVVAEGVRDEVQIDVLSNNLGDDSNNEEGQHIRWNELMRSIRFWLYIFAVLAAGVSYAFIPYYFKLGSTFAVSMDTLIVAFQVTGVAATVFGIASALLTDVLAIPSIPALASGSKNVMLLFLALQTGLCVWLTSIAAARAFVPFIVVVAVMKMVMAAHAGCAALIARDLFGARNSCLVFGIGGGLALGGGEGLSAWFMAAVDARAGLDPSPQSYDTFFWGAAAWSTVGFVALLSLTRWPHRECARRTRLSCQPDSGPQLV